MLAPGATIRVRDQVVLCAIDFSTRNPSRLICIVGYYLSIVAKGYMYVLVKSRTLTSVASTGTVSSSMRHRQLCILRMGAQPYQTARSDCINIEDRTFLSVLKARETSSIE